MTADNNPHAIATADQLTAARRAVADINDLKRRIAELERCDAGHRQHAEIVNANIGLINEHVADLQQAITELRRRP